jgi:hypothetical protein
VKLLLGAPRRAMRFAHTLDKIKAMTEGAVQALGAIARDREPATLLWPVRSERGDNEVPAGPDGAAQGVNGALAVGQLGLDTLPS